MVNEWPWRNIRSLGKVVTGKTPSTRDPQNFGGPYPFITIPDLERHVYIRDTARTISEQGAALLNSCLLPANAVMMSCIATVGKCGITVEPSFTNQQINSVICNKNVEPLYLYYCFRQLKIQLEATGGGGSVYTNVSRSRFSELEVPIAPLSEQRVIAHTLGTLDDKIELNRRMSQTLEAVARALFKNWFVDFEPFRDQGMQDSPLGPIPRGWRVGKLNNIASFIKGVSYRSDDLQECTVALVTLKSVARGGGYQQEGLKPYIGEYKPEQQLQPGELIVAHTDLTQAAEVLGRTARVQAHSQFPTLVASLDLVIVRPMGQATSNEFLYSMLSRSEFQEHAYGYANGTTVLHLSAKALPEYQCILPPPIIIETFTRLVRPVYERIDYNEAQSHTVAAIRDTLLPELLPGEIRVKDAEKFMEEAI